MSRTLQYGRIARDEFDGAMDRYESEQSGLGLRFEEEVKSYILQILKQPNRFPLATSIIRVDILVDFPFSIYYRERGDTIFIVGIYHHSRKPDGWKNRK